MSIGAIARGLAVRPIMGLAAGLMGFLSSCDETLPPYEDPQIHLKGAAYASYTYVSNNMLTVSVSVQNLFDETLQERSELGGSVRITPAGAPGFARTIPIRPEHIITPGTYDPLTRTLTIDPEEIVWFEVIWNLTDDRGRSLPDSLFRFLPDPTCNLRKIARRETFIIEASVELFGARGHITCAPVEISLCYINTWVDGRLCPAIQETFACGLIGY